MDTKAARRYASALFNASRAAGNTERVQADLALLMECWNRTPAFRRTLESPRIAGERKQDLVATVFRDAIDPLTSLFLRLLIEKRREALLPAVTTIFGELADELRGLVRAMAIVATPLSDADRTRLVQGLRQRTGKEIDLAVVVNEDIIGGAIVRLGDTVIDGSVRGALERLRESMLREST